MAKGLSGDESLRRTIKEIVKTTQIQRRHLLFWLFIGLFSLGAVFLAYNAGYLFASEPEIQESTDFGGASYTVKVGVYPDGRVVVNGRQSHRILQPLTDFDELRYKVLDKPGYALDELQVIVQFKEPLPKETKLRSFAIHGIDEASEEQVDDHTLVYSASGIGPQAVYTIVAELPKHYIKWPLWRQFLATIVNLPGFFWLSLACALPILTLLLLMTMFWGDLKRLLPHRSQPALAEPPGPVPPAIVGILTRGKISSREVAATLLDLANRGYLTIYNKGEGRFSFAKRKPWKGLTTYETLLLSQLFTADDYKSSQEDIELSLGDHLFSPEIARVYLAMYDEAARLGYFRLNPGRLHQRYRAIGLGLFFVSLAAFIATLAFGIQPTYTLFLWAGAMSTALIVMIAADSVPLLTPAGEQARNNWLSFDDYLSQSALISYTEGAQAHYEKYLSYAVVFGKEVDWANRFRNHPFARPDWYDSNDDEAMAIETFANGLHTIVGSIAKLFAAAKEPTVE